MSLIPYFKLIKLNGKKILSILRAIFLDRDGVLVEPIFKNGRSYAARNLKNFKIYSYAKSELKKLRELGFKLIVVTNQPDIGNNKMDIKILYRMNYILKKKLLLDCIYFCKHSKKDNCQCRKPEILNFLKAKRKFKIDFSKSFVIGDRKSDIDAGNKIKCKTIFIDRNYSNDPVPKNYNYICKNLKEAVYLISQNKD